MKKITKYQFWLLLLAYIAMLVVGVFVAVPQYTAPTQADNAIDKSRYCLQWLSDRQFAVFMIWFLGVPLMAWLVGLISLFFFWRPGVYLFLAGVCGRLVAEYLRHSTPTSGWLLYDGAELGLELVIVAFALFGPAKHLFQKQRSLQI